MGCEKRTASMMQNQQEKMLQSQKGTQAPQ